MRGYLSERVPSAKRECRPTPGQSGNHREFRSCHSIRDSDFSNIIRLAGDQKGGEKPAPRKRNGVDLGATDSALTLIDSSDGG